MICVLRSGLRQSSRSGIEEECALLPPLAQRHTCFLFFLQVGVLLDELAKDGHLVLKMFKKSKIYMPNQSKQPELPPEEVAALDAETAATAGRIAQFKAENKELKIEVDRLGNLPRTSDCPEMIAALEQDVCLVPFLVPMHSEWSCLLFSGPTEEREACSV